MTNCVAEEFQTVILCILQAAREEARKRKHEEKKKVADQRKLQEKIKLLEKDQKERSKKEKHEKILRDSGKEHRHKVR